VYKKGGEERGFRYLVGTVRRGDKRRGGGVAVRSVISNPVGGRAEAGGGGRGQP